MRVLDLFYLEKEEPIKGCLLFLRGHILNFDKGITEVWKYQMPFFYYKGKMFCYLWTHKNSKLPYIGFVQGSKIEHPALIMKDRARMKIMLLDPHNELPLKAIDTILKTGIDLFN